MSPARPIDGSRRRVLRGAAFTGLILAATSSAFAQRQACVPAFNLEALDGTQSSHRSLQGKVVLVDFWATWCEPCLQEIPHWNELYARYRDEGFAVLGVTLQSGTASEIKREVERLDIKYRVVVGDDQAAKGFGGILGFPATFLVDREGRIHKRYLGQRPLKHVQIEADIRKLLAEKTKEFAC